MESIISSYLKIWLKSRVGASERKLGLANFATTIQIIILKKLN